MGKFTAILVVAISATILVSVHSTVAAATALNLESGLLQTPGPLFVNGRAQADLDAGALHMRVPIASLGGVTLQADHIEVGTDWHRGYDAWALGSNQRVLRPGDGTGRDVHNFTRPNLTLSALQASPEVLVILDSAASTASSTSLHQLEVQAVADEVVTRVEYSDQFTSARPERVPGFHYRTPGTWTRSCGFDHGIVTGDFQLFVNNVTIHVRNSNEGTWDDWTGYQEKESTGPVTEFESRVTTVNVTQGVLQIDSPTHELCAYGPQPTLGVDGVVSTSQATGALQASKLVFEYDDAPLEMQGAGVLKFAAFSTHGAVNGVDSRPGDAMLSMEPSGVFAVTETAGVHAVSVAAPTEPAWRAPWAWLVVLVVGVPLFVYGSRHAFGRGLLGVRWTRGPRFKPAQMATADLEAVTDVMRKYVERGTWTQEHTRAFGGGMLEALNAVGLEQFERAADAASQVVEEFPSSRDAWRVYAQTSLEARRYDEAADAYARLNELCQGAVPEVLRDLARALWKARRRDEADAALLEYAQADPESAASLVLRPGLIGLGIDVVDELYPDMLYAWAMRAWDDHRCQEAAYVFAALCRRSPHTTLHMVGEDRYTPLWRSVFIELRLDALKVFIRHAIVHDRMALAHDAFAELAFRNPGVARAFAREPPHEILLDNVRVAHMLDHAPRRDGDAAAPGN